MTASRQSPVVDSASFAAATNVPRETLRRLNLYESALRAWQPRINLVANATLTEVWQRHFYDSAQLVPLIPASARTLVDLGSGGGFPGMVLAIMLAEQRAAPDNPAAGGATGAAAAASMARAGRPGLRITLVESDVRKGAFLREVARQTGTVVEILSTRIEKSETHVKLGQVDVVTARALAPLEKLLALAAPLFGPQTTGLFLKGQAAQAEVEAARRLWSFDASLVPSVTAADASIVVVRRLSRV